MTRIHLAVLLILAAIGALLFALPVVLVGGPSFATAAARAATPPSFSVADGTWAEGGAFAPTATKSAAAGSYSKITFTVTAGTCSSSRFVAPPPLTVTVGNKQIIVPGPVVKTIDNSIADGDCTIIIRITAVRFATISRSTATWTVKDNDVAPPSFDPERVASWIPAPGPLTVGSYAFLTNGAPCCKGLIVKVLAAGLSSDADPARRVNVYTVQYAADPSGSYPAANPYWRALVDFNYAAGLQVVAPAP